MCRTPALLCLGLATLLAGCGSGEPGEEGASAPLREATSPSGPLDTTAKGRLGPIDFEYDFMELTLTEVSLPLPPDYETEVLSHKLIPSARAELLGQQCQYGESGELRTCTVEAEPGLALALLERPLAFYRDTFVEDGSANRLNTAYLDGARGFSFVTEEDGGETEYRFVPVEDRTLLAARRFTSDLDPGASAIDEVVRSVERALEARETRSPTPSTQ